MKQCNRCQNVLNDMNWQISYQTRQYYLCKECDKLKQRQRQASLPKRKFFKRYGLTETAYEELVAGSNGCCAICSTQNNNGKDLCIDHCHTTGKVRGLLCNKCNMALGLLSDRIDLLDKAKEYLNENR